MLNLNVIEGFVCIVVGIALLAAARWIAAASAQLWEHRIHCRAGAGSFFGYFRRRSVRIAVIFWRVCGLLWVIGGASLLVYPEFAVRVPWNH